MLGVSPTLVAQAERSAIGKICAALDLPSPYDVQVIDDRKIWQAKQRRAG